MIDLHLHTTASDGTCTPEQLVEQAHRVGIRTFAVTDHDTMQAVARATNAASSLGLTCIPGMEVTTVHNGKTVHVLAYFLRDLSPALSETLAEQRRSRRERAATIAARLSALGAPVDVAALLKESDAPGKSLARPQVAQALVAAGHVSSVGEAFEKYLHDSGPAYVPHQGASPSEVIRLIVEAGGLASLAHPGHTRVDDLIPELVSAGLEAIEAYHSAHDDSTTQHYLATARRYGLEVSGGSDYHGAGTRRSEFFGVTHLPAAAFDGLSSRHDSLRRTD